MKSDFRRKILVAGCIRSGTSLLASYLGAHRDISMLCEDPTDNWLRGIGVSIVGNKLTLPEHLKRIEKYQRMGVILIGIKRDFDSNVQSIITRDDLSMEDAVMTYNQCKIIESIYDFTLRYEDLLSRPTKVLESVCTMLGITFDINMLTGDNKTWNYPEYCLTNGG